MRAVSRPLRTLHITSILDFLGCPHKHVHLKDPPGSTPSTQHSIRYRENTQQTGLKERHFNPSLPQWLSQAKEMLERVYIENLALAHYLALFWLFPWRHGFLFRIELSCRLVVKIIYAKSIQPSSQHRTLR